MYEDLGMTYKIQRGLSVAQALPLIGPVIVSPIKAVVSVIQIVIGIAVSILLSIGYSLICNNDSSYKKIQTPLSYTSLGVLSLGYSLANMMTLGIAGYKIEMKTSPSQAVC